MAQVTNFDVVPVVAYPNTESGYRQPLFPRVRERSCSRRPWIRQELVTATGGALFITNAIAAPIVAAISLSFVSCPALDPFECPFLCSLPLVEPISERLPNSATHLGMDPV